MALMAGFPFLLLFVWRNKKIDNAELRAELIHTCYQHRLHIHDIRIWITGNQIINALVAGILPRFRIILLTDSLVKLFPRNELLAIVRHEAGHLRLWHLPIRIGSSATLVRWPDTRHDLFHDTHRDHIFERIAEWLRHFASRADENTVTQVEN